MSETRVLVLRHGQSEGNVAQVWTSTLEGYPLTERGREQARAAGERLADVPVVVGGIIPDADAETLRSLGVAAVFTPKDYDATAIMARVLDEVRAAHALPRLVGADA